MLETIKGLWLSFHDNGTYLAHIRIQPILHIRLWEARLMDSKIMEHMN